MSSRILIVEDEANVRLNYRITLETEGYEVVEAATAASALLLLIEQSFAVAILDMRLPGMAGLELLAKMREMEIMVPAMIVTAYSDVPHGESPTRLR
jgi:DNA-binding NtrC family response regulator